MSSDNGSEDWSRMLGRLVAAAGGEAEVAVLLCKMSKRRSQTDFDTARRNLSNWTAGKVVPQRRNFQALTQALQLDREPELLDRWNRFYAAANATGTPAPGRVETAGPSIPARSAGQRSLGAGFSILSWRPASIAFAFLTIAAGPTGYLTLAPAQDDGRTIGYLPYAELKVGETALVHAKRGRCGEPPPEWHEIEHELPQLKTGRLVDDGLGMSQSSTCGGLTPGRLVRFVAETPGDEVFELFQRQIRVVVRP